MPVITLPDGSQKSFDHPITVAELAASIGSGLAKAALAGKVNGRLVDTSATLDHDAAVSIVTDKDPDGLEIIRHSTAHLLANAVQELFPGAQVTIGPVIEDGFYYDFAYKTPFSSDDLAAIEKRMAEIAGATSKCTAACCRAMPPSSISSASASTTRPRSSRRFRPASRSVCTARATGKTCAAVRTCRAPASSRRSS